MVYAKVHKSNRQLGKNLKPLGDNTSNMNIGIIPLVLGVLLVSASLIVTSIT